MSDTRARIEHDSLGELAVPADVLWGAQTQRAIGNFTLSTLVMPRAFLRAMGLIKAAAARVNAELGELDSARAVAIEQAAMQVARGDHDAAFPVDVFQTGSGTSSNMNANEVIATLATRQLGQPVHPNDHVNCSQSSNDVIPSAIHVGAALLVSEVLLPSLQLLSQTLAARGDELRSVVKTGRTHLMDAMPLTLGQELGGWQAQIDAGRQRLTDCLPRLTQLALGGTAVGTGINAPLGYSQRISERLAGMTGLPFVPSANFFAALAAQDTAVELSGQLKVLAVSLIKIANDLRWMNSGPLAGLAELSLPALQPGSSIMPGKVNPVIPEAVAMVAAQVIGNDATITVAGQSGNFQLNVMLPVIAYNLMQSIELLAAAARVLAETAIQGFTVNREQLAAALSRNPILVTALNPLIGYEAAAAIAKEAYRTGEPILTVAARRSGLPLETLAQLLDPASLTRAGGKVDGSG